MLRISTYMIVPERRAGDRQRPEPAAVDGAANVDRQADQFAVGQSGGRRQRGLARHHRVAADAVHQQPERRAAAAESGRLDDVQFRQTCCRACNSSWCRPATAVTPIRSAPPSRRGLQGDLNQMIGLANTSDGQGGYLFAGSQQSAPPFSQSGNNVTYKGDSTLQSIQGVAEPPVADQVFRRRPVPEDPAGQRLVRHGRQCGPTRAAA